MFKYEPSDWLSHLFDIKGSMFREIIYRVLLCVLWAAVVVFAQSVLKRHGHSVAIPSQAHALIGTALGLLLVFRTNSSYDRFWEGRKLWGSMVNTCRNLARAGSVYLAADWQLATRLLQWTIAFPWATMGVLRAQHGLGPGEIELPELEREAVLESGHVPLAVACRLSATIAEARRRELISDFVQMTLDNNVQLLMDYVGACERIRNTPLPFAYVVHLRRAIIAYCFTLPFALVADFGWATVFATLLIAYTLYGIEEIGVEIEDPFGLDVNDLPLIRLCGMIEENVREVIENLPGRPPELAPVRNLPSSS